MLRLQNLILRPMLYPQGLTLRPIPTQLALRLKQATKVSTELSRGWYYRGGDTGGRIALSSDALYSGC